MQKSLPVIALVGQPNVGKSSLLNKIAGNRSAVTSDIAGTTRDRQYLNTSWNGADFTLVDTAGLSISAKDQKTHSHTQSENINEQLEQNVSRQIDVALQEADMLIWVVDGKQPSGSIPQSLKQKFRKIPKPVILAVNKLEKIKDRDAILSEFMSLGIKSLFAVSALTGAGLGDMLDAIASLVPSPLLAHQSLGDGRARGDVPSAADPFGNTQGRPEPSRTGEGQRGRTDENNPIAVSIVGKPNVGKSSIFNQILKEERVVVSPVPGTTRTAIDSNIAIGDINYTFIDTAGLKKKEYRQEQPDVFSGFQTFKSIRRSDVCFLVIDATEEITKQDQRVAAEIFALEKACIILANKCDLLSAKKASGKLGKNAASLEKNRDDKYQDTRDHISHHFPFLWMCPLFFVSGLTGEGLQEAVDAIKPIWERRHKIIDEETLKEFLGKLMKKNPPKLLRDQKKPKVFSLHQADINPPAFQLKVNHPAAISSQFRKYLENSITRELDFYGTPIILRLKGKDKA
jgi:GTP-binding protein